MTSPESTCRSHSLHHLTLRKHLFSNGSEPERRDRVGSALRTSLAHTRCCIFSPREIVRATDDDNQEVKIKSKGSFIELKLELLLRATL